MHPTIPVAPIQPAAVIQLSMFGDDNVIAPPAKSTPPKSTRAQLHDSPAAPTKSAGGKLPAQAPHPSLRQTIPAKEHASSPELLVDPDELEPVDLESVDASDTPETILAKRMFLRMMWDFDGKVEEAEPDLFGETSAVGVKARQADQNRLDALIWLYSLNPDGSLVTFEWVCDVLGFDPHRVRRIVARSMGRHLKRLVHLLSTIVSPEHAQTSEEKISDYLDISHIGISNWIFN